MAERANFHFKSNYIKFFLSLLLLNNIINLSLCSSCYKEQSIFDKACFNDVLRFNSKQYRAGHFATYKNGDMIVEFSDDGGSNDGFSRIFYGLKANGRYYFPNESPTWEIQNIGKIDNARGRYESLNKIVVTENDLNRDNEFLFSTSSYDSLTELHNIHNKTYTYTKTTSFVGNTIFSFQYPMVEVKSDGKIFYFLAFTYSSSSSRNGDCIIIKKFGFKSFSFNDIDTFNNKNEPLYNNHDNRIIHLFALENLSTLVLFYDKKVNNANYLTLKFYDYDLNIKGNEINCGSINIVDPSNRDKDGVFFKSVELPDNKRAFAFFFNSNANELYLNISQFSINNDNSIIKTDILTSKHTNGYWFSAYITFNDII